MARNILIFVIGCLLGCTTSATEPTQKQDTLYRAVTDSIAPALASEHELGRPFTLKERMAFYNVPGVSIAVINDGEIVWAEGFGNINNTGDGPVTDSTLFQAASTSKPVAATVALQMVHEGLMDLNTDINKYLNSWHLDWNDQNPDNPVTLRHLLSHTGGLNVHGFPGYPAGANLPELTDILDGSRNSNTQRVEVQLEPGSTVQYSGGGYTIMQQMMMDIFGHPFPKIMDDNLLSPLGMKNSSYDQQFPSSRDRSFATAHIMGEPVTGDYHTYPEKAAAGLWTTPKDLAEWILSLQNGLHNPPDTPVDSTVVADMITRQIAGYGLGPQIEGNDSSLRFRHAGSNPGYQADMIGYVGEGKGAVVMTNSDTGSRLISEIIHRIAEYYDWPGYPEIRQTGYVSMSSEQLESLTGTYRLPHQSGIDIEITLQDDQLYLNHPQTGPQPLFAKDEEEFFAPFIRLNHIMFIESAGVVEEMRIGPSGRQEVLEKVD